MSDAQDWGAYVQVGPGDEELRRLADTLAALAHYEPRLGRLVVVDDAPQETRGYRAEAGALADRLTVIRNPRPADCDWWSDGMVHGTFAALTELLDAGGVRYALKLDTDALVIGSFLDRVGTEFDRHPELGAVGSCTHDAAGESSNQEWWKPIGKLGAPVSLWRPPKGPLRGRYWGAGRRLWPILRAALGHGYRLGEHCQGGSYAVSLHWVQHVRSAGWLDPRQLLGTGLGEDVALSLCISAVGGRLGNMVDGDGPFAVRHVGLPGQYRDLHARGYGVLHSIKSCDDFDEWELRRYFAELRAAEIHGDEITETTP
jgi:hypothetical protein